MTEFEEIEAGRKEFRKFFPFILAFAAIGAWVIPQVARFFG